MGTDITMYAEKRVNGKWEKIGDVFKNVYYREDRPLSSWNQPYTDQPYLGRNYDLFAILANVRNSTGFANGRTLHGFKPISNPKGLPEDASDEVKELLDNYGYGYSYFTLKELKDYDWEQQIVRVGVITEEQYVKMKETRQNPDTWCGGAGGRNVITVTADDMDRILSGKRNRDDSLEYYVRTEFYPTTYKECCEGFWKETIPALEEQIPDGGSDGDVRILFSFDC